MSIDVHVHPWTREFMMKNDPIIKACEFFKVRQDELPESIDSLIEEMDEQKVERSIILGQDTHATPNPHFRHYTISNDEMARIASKSGGRLVAFAGIDPNAGIDALKELKRAVKDLSMQGLKIHSSVNSVYPNDRKRMYPIYDICQEYRLPILFHTGTTGLGYCGIRFSKPEYIDEICYDYPDLNIIIAHFGWPWTEVAIAIALRNRNVFIDISGWKPRYIPTTLITYMNGPLQDRFLFGTDYPMIRHRVWMNDFKQSLETKLKPEVRVKLLRGNALKLLHH